MARRGPAISEDAVSALEAHLATSFPDDSFLHADVLGPMVGEVMPGAKAGSVGRG